MSTKVQVQKKHEGQSTEIMNYFKPSDELFTSTGYLAPSHSCMTSSYHILGIDHYLFIFSDSNISFLCQSVINLLKCVIFTLAVCLLMFVLWICLNSQIINKNYEKLSNTKLETYFFLNYQIGMVTCFQMVKKNALFFNVVDCFAEDIFFLSCYVLDWFLFNDEQRQL